MGILAVGEPTKPTAKSTAARRVFASKPVAHLPHRARPPWTQKQAASDFLGSLYKKLRMRRKFFP